MTLHRRIAWFVPLAFIWAAPASPAAAQQGPASGPLVAELQAGVVRLPVAPVAPVTPVASLAPAAAGMVDADTVRRRTRPKAIEYSVWYERRATVHWIASWTTVPLFAAEYVTGQELFAHGPESADWAKDSHGAIAGSLAGLFAVNTVTGVWNLWDARHDPNGRTWRTLHSILMLAADAGFAYAGSLADDAEDSADIRRKHKRVAITSGSIALASYVMMLPPLRRD